MLGGMAVEHPSHPGRPAVYLAGPDGFTPAGLAWHRDTLLPAVETAGLSALSPWAAFGDRFAALARQPPGPDRERAYRELDGEVGAANAALIDRAAGVLAVLDGPDVDSGTAAEVGYACTRVPVVGLRTDVRPAGDNEGVTVNLQVEHFIRRSGGSVHRDLGAAVADLARLLRA
jgi:nucleoside 2-deoxyribosyltransferase